MSFIPQAGYALVRPGLPVIFPIHPRTGKMMTSLQPQSPLNHPHKTPRLPRIPPLRIKCQINHHRFRRPAGGGVHPRRPLRHITSEHRAAGDSRRWIEASSPGPMHTLFLRRAGSCSTKNRAGRIPMATVMQDGGWWTSS